MKFSISVSNTGLMVVMALVLGALLITDIHAHRTAGAYTASGASDRVVTKEFVLIDDNGSTRARIGMNDKGSPCMQLFDRKGKQRAQLRLNGDDVPSLRLYDANGTLRSAMSFNLGTMQPGVALFDENGVGAWLNPGWWNSGMQERVFDEDVPFNNREMSKPFLWTGPDHQEVIPIVPREDLNIEPKDGIIHLEFRSDSNR